MVDTKKFQKYYQSGPHFRIENPNPSGRYVITVASHETACVDGVILDAWNCGEKCVVGFFDMSNFKL